MSPRSSYSSSEDDRECQRDAFGGARLNLFDKKDYEHEKEGWSPLLPQWNKPQDTSQKISIRSARLRKIHLGWLLASILFVALILENATLAWTRQTISEVSKSAPAASASKSSDQALSGVTLVSAFFLVSNGKKHTSDEYWNWIRNFLENVEQPIVFYTSPDLLERMIPMRGDKPITWNVDYSDAADMPPIQSLGGAEWAQAMEWSDPESFKHVAGVYSPWTAKPWMVREAKTTNPYRSKYFFWVDAGGFRESNVKHHFRGLPQRLEEMYKGLPDETVILGDTTFVWPEGQAGVDFAKEATEKGWMDRADCHIQGGWYGGKAEGIDWWYEETLRITALQSMLHRFAGKEQDIWTHVARLNYHRVGVQNMFLNKGIGSTCGEDAWFAYEYWADSPECEIPLWNGPAEHAIAASTPPSSSTSPV